MKKRISTKTLLVFVVALVSMAIMPVAASADLFLEEGYETIPEKKIPLGAATVTAAKFPASVTGKAHEIGGKTQIDVLSTPSGPISCSSVEVSGASLTKPASQLTLTPKYSGCNFAGIETTVAMNSCKYVISGLGALSGEATKASGAISCSGTDQIEVSVSAACVVKVPAQPLNANSELANLVQGGVKRLAVGVIGSGLSYTVPNEMWCHTVAGLPTKGTHGDGTMNVVASLADLYLEETYEIIPEEKGPLGASTVNAKTYPASITGKAHEVGGNTRIDVLATPSGPIGCDSVEVNGGTLSKSASQLTLTPKYSGCDFAGIETTVAMNSCKYVISGLGALSDEATKASGAISCSGTDKIQVSVSAACVVTIPAQPLNVNSELVNLVQGGVKRLAVGVIGSGLSYTVPNETWCHTFGGLPTKGTHEDGTTEVITALSGN